MKKVATLGVAVLAALVLAAPANAVTYSAFYGWEDETGTETILGSYGNLANPLNVTEPHVHTGDRALQVSEEPHDGTPQAYVAYIEYLDHGDLIDVSLWGWDDDNSGDLDEPKCRIWGHYAQSGDVNSYAGSASGPGAYSTGIGWEELTHLWTFDSDGDTRDALVIEFRPYSFPYTDPEASTDYWADDLTVEVTSSNPLGSITTPGGTTYIPEPGSLVLLAMGGLALIRRR